MRSTIFDQEPEKAEWLIDLLTKLGQEDDAYHAVALVIIEYGAHLAVDSRTDDQGDGDDPLAEAGVTEEESSEEPDEHVEPSAVEEALATLPPVVVRRDLVPRELQPGRFLAEMARRVVEATPVNLHREARRRRATANQL